jgi:hypothetical protein
LKVAGDRAEVLVRFAWYRIDENDLRSTLVRQTWLDTKSAWKLAGEEAVEGPRSLLGDPATGHGDGAHPGAAPPSKRTYLPTVVIGQAHEPDPTTTSDESNEPAIQLKLPRK